MSNDLAYQSGLRSSSTSMLNHGVNDKLNQQANPNQHRWVTANGSTSSYVRPLMDASTGTYNANMASTSGAAMPLQVSNTVFSTNATSNTSSRGGFISYDHQLPSYEMNMNKSSSIITPNYDKMHIYDMQYNRHNFEMPPPPPPPASSSVQQRHMYEQQQQQQQKNYHAVAPMSANGVYHPHSPPYHMPSTASELEVNPMHNIYMPPQAQYLYCENQPPHMYPSRDSGKVDLDQTEKQKSPVGTRARESQRPFKRASPRNRDQRSPVGQSTRRQRSSNRRAHSHARRSSSRWSPRQRSLAGRGRSNSSRSRQQKSSRRIPSPHRRTPTPSSLRQRSPPIQRARSRQRSNSLRNRHLNRPLYKRQTSPNIRHRSRQRSRQRSNPRRSPDRYRDRKRHCSPPVSTRSGHQSSPFHYVNKNASDQQPRLDDSNTDKSVILSPPVNQPATMDGYMNMWQPNMTAQMADGYSVYVPRKDSESQKPNFWYDMSTTDPSAYSSFMSPEKVPQFYNQNRPPYMQSEKQNYQYVPPMVPATGSGQYNMNTMPPYSQQNFAPNNEKLVLNNCIPVKKCGSYSQEEASSNVDSNFYISNPPYNSTYPPAMPVTKHIHPPSEKKTTEPAAYPAKPADDYKKKNILETLQKIVVSDKFLDLTADLNLNKNEVLEELNQLIGKAFATQNVPQPSKAPSNFHSKSRFDNPQPIEKSTTTTVPTNNAYRPVNQYKEGQHNFSDTAFNSYDTASTASAFPPNTPVGTNVTSVPYQAPEKPVAREEIEKPIQFSNVDTLNTIAAKLNTHPKDHLAQIAQKLLTSLKQVDEKKRSTTFSKSSRKRSPEQNRIRTYKQTRKSGLKSLSNNRSRERQSLRSRRRSRSRGTFEFFR